MKLLRSLLYVPGNDMRKINKSPEVSADAIILDLEDAVPIEEKETARIFAKDSIQDISQGNKASYIRINGQDTEFFEKDVKSVTKKHLDGIMLPKSESKESIYRLEEIMKGLEEERNLEKIGIIPLIETCKGVLNLKEICKASDRIEALAFGAVDYTGDLGTERSVEGTEILYARSKISNACSAFELEAIDTPWTKISDWEGLEEDCERGGCLGFDGKQVIHPDHLEKVNKVYSPSGEEVKHAKKVVEAFEEAKEKGLAAASLEGEMIDKATYKTARKILSKYKLIKKARCKND